jgi:hypothetical protein
MYILFRPTFKFYKNVNEIATILGARPEELVSLIEQHVGTPEESGSIKLFKCSRSCK